jgi:hypothetical protein
MPCVFLGYYEGLVLFEFFKRFSFGLQKINMSFLEKSSMKVKQYYTPSCDVVLIGPHTSVWIISKSCETLVVPSLGNDVI